MNNRFRAVVVGDGSVVPGHPITRQRDEGRTRRTRPDRAHGGAAPAAMAGAAPEAGAGYPEAGDTPLQALQHLQQQARELLAAAGKLDWALGLAAHMTQVAQSEETLRQVRAVHQQRLAHALESMAEEPEQNVQAATQLVHTLLPLVAAAAGRPRAELPVRPFIGMVSDMLVRMGPQSQA